MNTEPANLIQCRDSNGIAIAPSQPWEAGKPVTFIYAPAGLHMITAGFRKGETITICVENDAQTAIDLQSSYDHLMATEPNQEPFSDEDHAAAKATLRFPVGVTQFTWGAIKGNEGVIVAAEPTSYGAEAVNGKVYRSWSPEFATDADYSKAHQKNKHWTFPDGVKGSESNPARIVGVSFVMGALTNRPAFRAMPPVKAKKAEAAIEDAIQAGGPGSGPRKENGFTDTDEELFKHHDSIANKISEDRHSLLKVDETGMDEQQLAIHRAKLATFDEQWRHHDKEATRLFKKKGSGIKACTSDELTLEEKLIQAGGKRKTGNFESNEDREEASQAAEEAAEAAEKKKGHLEHAEAANAHTRAAEAYNRHVGFSKEAKPNSSRMAKYHRGEAEYHKGMMGKGKVKSSDAGDPENQEEVIQAGGPGSGRRPSGRITKIINVRTHMFSDSGSKKTSVDWEDEFGEKGTTSGDPENGHMKALIARGEREGVKHVKSSSPIQACAADELTLSDLQHKVQSAASADSRFNHFDSSGSTALGCYCYVADIIRDEDDDEWFAIVSCNNTTYKVEFLIDQDDGSIVLSDETEEVARKTVYAVDALCYNGELIQAAWSPQAREAALEARKNKTTEHSKLAIDLVGGKQESITSGISPTGSPYHVYDISHKDPHNAAESFYENLTSGGANGAYKPQRVHEIGASRVSYKDDDGERHSFNFSKSGGKVKSSTPTLSDLYLKGASQEPTLEAIYEKCGEVKAGAPAGNDNASGEHKRLNADTEREWNHVSKKNADGTPMRVRRNGKTQTWKTRPGEFRIPVKHGMYEYGNITHETSKEWNPGDGRTYKASDATPTLNSIFARVGANGDPAAVTN